MFKNTKEKCYLFQFRDLHLIQTNCRMDKRGCFCTLHLWKNSCEYMLLTPFSLCISSPTLQRWLNFGDFYFYKKVSAALVQSFPPCIKKIFGNYSFFHNLGKTLQRKNSYFWNTQKCFEISTPNFYIWTFQKKSTFHKIWRLKLQFKKQGLENSITTRLGKTTYFT